jgi:5-methylcytosine-specific restriction endonuclease McrA
VAYANHGTPRRDRALPITIPELAFGYGAAFTPHGLKAHIRLLHYAWHENDGVGCIRQLKDDVMARVSGVSTVMWRKVKDQALHGFTLADGKWVHLELQAAGLRWEQQKRGRQPLRPSVRFFVLKRDGFRCAYCGRSGGEYPLAVDHIIPVAAGGNDHPSNLITACVECNAGKSDKVL